MLGGKDWDEWIEEYSHSHTHPINKLTHKIGIPMIVLSLPLFLAAIFIKGFWIAPIGLFAGGFCLSEYAGGSKKCAAEVSKSMNGGKYLCSSLLFTSVRQPV